MNLTGKRSTGAFMEGENYRALRCVPPCSSEHQSRVLLLEDSGREVPRASPRTWKSSLVGKGWWKVRT